jgi:hypothetical protein
MGPVKEATLGYTILDNVSGDARANGVTLEEAATYVLTHDGAEYDILPRDGDGGEPLALYVKSRNGSWREAIASSFAEDIDAAKSEIFAQVVNTRDWVSSLRVMSDADYEAFLADADA